MNKILLAILLMIAPAALFAQVTNYTITGHLDNVKASEVHISFWGASKYQTVSAKVENNTYTLTFAANQGNSALLKCGDINAVLTKDNVLSVYLGTENFTINHKNKFSQATFTGSEANVEYQQLYEKNRAYNKRINALREQIEEKEKLAGKNSPVQMAALDSLVKQRNDAIYGDYMYKHPHSPLYVWAFNSYARDMGKINPDKIQPLFDMLPDSIKAMASAKSYQQQIINARTFDDKVAIGKIAPDFTQNDTAGVAVTLSSYRGKYVLLDFWASWCGPCRAENPNVVKVYQKFHDKGFEILSVSLDMPGAKAKWLKAIHDDHLTWTHVSDLQYWDNVAVKLYGVQSVPQNFLIDPNGKIIARSLRGEDLDAALSKIYTN